MRALRVSILAGLGAASLCAQGSVGGPISGVVFDRGAGALRPILGIPGASLLGDGFDLGYEIRSAAIAPRQDFAIATAAGGSLHLLRLRDGAAAEMTLNGLPSGVERIVFSPSGSAAAIYAAGAVQTIGGLPDAPALGASFNLSGAPGAMALSDDGRYLLFISGGSVRLRSTAADDRGVIDASDGALVAFAPGGHDAAVMDSAGAGLTLLRDVAGAPARQLVAAPDDSLASPGGLAFSADGKSLLLASGASRSVSMFDVAGAARNTVACDCAPS
ncbi:MAG TPA: hypothetical protein VGF59_24210, partial [Bryobacteraceae bacterium]